MTPKYAILAIFRYFQIRGFLEEKLLSQGKATQNVCNEPNFPPSELGALIESLLEKKKTKITENLVQTRDFK